MSLIIKKNTTFKIPRTGIIQDFLPSSLGGLALWLKADTGVTLFISQIIISGFTGIYIGANGTYNYNGDENWWELSGTSYHIESNGSLVDDNDQTVIATNNNNFQGAWTPTNYFSTITLSNAGEDADQGFVVVNGVYTRSDAGGPLASFTASGGRSIDWDPNDGDFWETSGGWYRNYGPDLNVNNWDPENGEEPVPTAVNSTSVRNVGSPTSTTVSDLVTAWADQSGNGNNATPVDDNPIYNISDLNSKPTISLTSMSDGVERVFIISSNPLGASGSTAFSVQYVEDVCDAEDDNGPIFGNFGGSEDTSVLAQTHYPYGPDCFVYDAFGTRLRKNEITPPVTITNVWTLYSVKSTNNDWQSFVNGQLMLSDPTNTYSNAIGGDGTLYIGKQTAAGTFNLKGKVAEVIVYNRVLTTPERQQVEAYLNSKYQIY